MATNNNISTYITVFARRVITGFSNTDFDILGASSGEIEPDFFRALVGMNFTPSKRVRPHINSKDDLKAAFDRVVLNYGETDTQTLLRELLEAIQTNYFEGASDRPYDGLENVASALDNVMRQDQNQDTLPHDNEPMELVDYEVSVPDVAQMDSEMRGLLVEFYDVKSSIESSYMSLDSGIGAYSSQIIEYSISIADHIGQDLSHIEATDNSLHASEAFAIRACGEMLRASIAKLRDAKNADIPVRKEQIMEYLGGSENE